jgi:hypothetical protein
MKIVSNISLVPHHTYLYGSRPTDIETDDFIKFCSMIHNRPSQGIIDSIQETVHE